MIHNLGGKVNIRIKNAFIAKTINEITKDLYRWNGHIASLYSPQDLSLPGLKGG